MRQFSEETKQKRKIYAKKFYEENKEYYKTWRKNNVASRLITVAKVRAKKKNIPFELEPEDLVIPTHCPVFGFPLQINMTGKSGGSFDSYSLDRINNTLGYIKGNVQVISHLANSMKSTASEQELKLFALWILKGENNASSGVA